ncbi:hypothetical protein GPECTOR_13g745 [Gonium pectorale]|uniref:Uncharacterized protein n=1 Tax=Gonium pectorale TaxID=33097 RepID=A0A150GNA1_GONPE|nr:hypothetical protein GPECTOR_13g745 [Gonium pectorale]|eukprot:KXZ51258.1 hypothetical protein GPECTOR_13g745 [Gonium pectorale]
MPFLMLGGHKQAIAHTVRPTSQEVYPAASVRPNPLFETSTTDLRESPQVRAAAMLATAMVGYGFVRVASGGGAGGGGSVRSSVVTRAVAEVETPLLPTSSRARLERLDQLYFEIEELKARNARVWEIAMALMEQDASLTVASATVKAAESMDLDNPAEAAAAAIAANSLTAERLAAATASAAVPIAAAVATTASRPASPPPSRPSGGAARGAVADVTAAAAASVAATVAMKTEEFTYPKYDPLRNVLAGATAPSGAHKYDMLRGLLRSGRGSSGGGAVQGQGQGQVQSAHKYDLVFDLLQSLKTSGDPAAILASGDPKYDPVWCLLNMKAPTRGSEGASKYDVVGTLLQAALAASPQPSRYDPVAFILQAEPLTGSHKYDIAEALLRGSWQAPLAEGLQDVPSWDPVSGLVAGASASGSPASSPRRQVSKYDMVGQALEAAAALPDDLASGKWAAQQPKDLLLGRRDRRGAPPRQRPSYSKYDMVGAALTRLDQLPDELASGRWAAENGRELFVDTLSRTVDEGPWGLLSRVRHAGSTAMGAVASATAPVRNTVAKAVGLPYEVAPGVVVKVEGGRRSPAGSPPRLALGAMALAAGAGGKEAAQTEAESEAELPVLVFSFKNAPGSNPQKAKAKEAKVKKAPEAPQPAEATVAAAKVVEAAAVPAPAPAVSVVVPEPAATKPEPVVLEAPVKMEVSEPEASPAADAPKPAAVAAVEPVKLDATTQPPPAAAAAAPVREGTSAPVRGAVRITAPGAAVAAAAAVAKASSPSATPAPAPAPVPAPAPAPAGKAPAAPAPTSAAPAPAPAPAAAAKPLTPSPAAAPKPAAAPLKMNELAVDLLVVMSMQRSRGGAAPSMDELLERFGEGFADVAVQLRSLRGNGPLLGRHPAVARLLRAASAAGSDGKGMWSQLYDMLGAVRDAEAAMPAFLEDCRAPYPLVHGLLSTGDAGQAVSVLCTLCNLVPYASAAPAASAASAAAPATAPAERAVVTVQA